MRFYRWGADATIDPKVSLHSPAYDSLGRGGRIAVLDFIVPRTIETEGMRGLIDSYIDKGVSLADDPAVAPAAETLDRLGVHSALLLGDVESL